MVHKVTQGQITDEVSQEYADYMRNRLGEKASSSGLVKQSKKFFIINHLYLTKNSECCDYLEGKSLNLAKIGNFYLMRVRVQI